MDSDIDVGFSPSRNGGTLLRLATATLIFSRYRYQVARSVCELPIPGFSLIWNHDLGFPSSMSVE
jgi:hypothetical protein